MLFAVAMALSVFAIYSVVDGKCACGESGDGGSVEEFTVTFQSNGGSHVAPLTVAGGSTIDLPERPTRGGYQFSGWFRDDGLLTQWIFASDRVSGDTTLYAKWDAIGEPYATTYTVTFDSRGGPALPPITGVDYNSRIVAPPAPGITGYRLSGWFKDDGLLDQWDFAADRVTGDTTLYAEWVVKSYIVKYYLPTATDSSWPQYDQGQVTFGQPYALADPGTRAPYSFGGWFLMPGGVNRAAGDESAENTARFPDGAGVDLWSYDADSDSISLFAYWTGTPGLDYTNSAKCSASLGTAADSGTLAIQEWYLGRKVTAVASEAFKGCAGFDELYLPAGLTELGDNAFDNCTGLSNDLVLPSGLTSIGLMAFYDCESLTGDLVLPSGLTGIGNYAFHGCKSLTGDLVLPSGLSAIKNGVFKFCAGLTGDLAIPAGVKDIGAEAFFGCKSLESLSFESGNRLESIGDHAFYRCTSLGTGQVKGISIPSGVTSLGKFAFFECENIESLSFGSNSALAGAIGEHTFSSCSSMAGDLEIPSGVKIIGTGAFDACEKIESLSFGQNSLLEEIGNYAFSSCSSMAGDLEIPSGVKIIGTGAFDACEKIESLSFGPNSLLEEIGDYAFELCSSMAGDLEIPSGVASIGDYAFYGCYGFSGDLVIPSSVATVGFVAFYGCKGFDGSLVIQSGATSIGIGAFSRCIGLNSLVLPSGMTSIADSAFSECTGISGLVLPTGLISIGQSTFYGCTGLTGDIVLPSGLTSIGFAAFYGLEGNLKPNTPMGLNSIYIPSSVTTIGDYAFMNAYTTINVEVNADLPGWGSYWSYECDVKYSRSPPNP
ncbi:MAG: leucine-rich repeat protein [Candidatus Methanoplasma sp.]|nr:leucine-rich repeat protein [Candidatus Methanoplasma sp.]